MRLSEHVWRRRAVDAAFSRGAQLWSLQILGVPSRQAENVRVRAAFAKLQRVTKALAMLQTCCESLQSVLALVAGCSSLLRRDCGGGWLQAFASNSFASGGRACCSSGCGIPLQIRELAELDMSEDNEMLAGAREYLVAAWMTLSISAKLGLSGHASRCTSAKVTPASSSSTGRV